MRITKAQSKLHDDALAILSLTRALSDEERGFVFKNYNPMATNNVTKGAIFFTPQPLAWTLAVFGHGWNGCKYLDLCAGIGVLAHEMLRHEGRDIKRMVCAEINREFVEIGKKLVPQAEWVWGDAFQLSVLEKLGTFDIGISNPPFGNVPVNNNAWMSYHGPAHLRAAEVLIRLCNAGGTMIVPTVDQGYDMKNRMSQQSTNLRRFYETFPGVTLAAEIDADEFKNDWQGVKPNVVVADLSLDGVEGNRPIGLPVQLPSALKQISFTE